MCTPKKTSRISIPQDLLDCRVSILSLEGPMPVCIGDNFGLCASMPASERLKNPIKDIDSSSLEDKQD